MFEEILKSILYFLPAYFANSSPVIFAKFDFLKFLARPIDGGKKIGNDFIFGSTKTWRGIFSGILVGGITGALLILPESFGFFSTLVGRILYGSLLGFGILFGDLLKSFIKRRLHIKSTDPFFPFDQLDYLGALALMFLFFPVPQINLLIILVISPLFPILANIIAYFLGWKKVWW